MHFKKVTNHRPHSVFHSHYIFCSNLLKKIFITLFFKIFRNILSSNYSQHKDPIKRIFHSLHSSTIMRKSIKEMSGRGNWKIVENKMYVLRTFFVFLSRTVFLAFCAKKPKAFLTR